jgi:SAM-dependent methyltransferase/uncharacterized protein YbaR (Trm112 family)
MRSGRQLEPRGMHPRIADLLRVDGDRLELTVISDDGGRIVEGYLRGAREWFPIESGIPCMLRGSFRPDQGAFAARHGLPRQQPGADTSGQAETIDTFSFKWANFRTYGETTGERAFLHDWYCGKFGLKACGGEALAAFYASFERILEVGPGSGFNTRFIAEHSRAEVVALDISAAARTTFEKVAALANADVVQADLNDAPFPDGAFDFVMADGVLHHTPDTKAGVRNLLRLVRPGGKFFFYVYRRMGAARAFCDAHIREAFGLLTPEECFEACKPLTELGRELSRLNAKITLTHPIPVLGIPAGEHDVQRLLYYNFVKCFWNDAFGFESSNLVNFDWYHPKHAWQHTEEEVAGWLAEFGITDYAFHPANPNGISCLLTRPAS